MEDFPAFMKGEENRIAAGSQSKGVTGWVFDGAGGMQMAYWVCETDGISEEHTHAFDEYVTVVQGTYTLRIAGQSIDIGKGDEFLIPRNVPHAGRFTAGTRTIHCFGGERAKRVQSGRYLGSTVCFQTSHGRPPK